MGWWMGGGGIGNKEGILGIRSNRNEDKEWGQGIDRFIDVKRYMG